MTCYEYDPTKPLWDGTSCSACPTNSEWDVDQSTCIATVPDVECVFEIPHGDKTLCLTESVGYTAFEDVSPKSSSEETTEFKEEKLDCTEIISKEELLWFIYSLTEGIKKVKIK